MFIGIGNPEPKTIPIFEGLTEEQAIFLYNSHIIQHSIFNIIFTIFTIQIFEGVTSIIRCISDFYKFLEKRILGQHYHNVHLHHHHHLHHGESCYLQGYFTSKGFLPKVARASKVKKYSPAKILKCF